MRTAHHNATALGRRPGRVAWVVLAALALAAPAAAQPVTDQGIADAIDNEFLYDPAIPSNNIDVSVVNGIATLTGTVNNVLAKDRASRLAETVKGVRSVVNQIAVEPTEMRSDVAILRDVESALLSDPATDSYEIGVTVKNGAVTLTGEVESWTEKELSGTVAKGVKGVTEVNNQIDVDYETDRADAEIKAEIEKALRWNVLVDDALIDVEANDGAVTLSGTVGSAAEKRQATRTGWVAGVKSVENNALEVERWARDEDLRKEKYVVKPADEIRQAIKDALFQDPRVLSFNVTPEVAGSTVTLRGVVDNLKARRAAEQVARNTVGVTYVTNRMKVRPAEGISDTEIAEDIRDAFLRDAYVERYDVTLDVIGGVAYLSGTVDSYFEKWRADDLASRVNGVVDVRNNLTVETEGALTYDPYVYDEYFYEEDWYDYEPYYTFETDMEIQDDIGDELFWSPFVDSDDVTVSVDDGVATLTGTVDSWSEFNAATENAYEGGATWVDNDLTVE